MLIFPPSFPLWWDLQWDLGLLAMERWCLRLPPSRVPSVGGSHRGACPLRPPPHQPVQGGTGHGAEPGRRQHAGQIACGSQLTGTRDEATDRRVTAQGQTAPTRMGSLRLEEPAACALFQRYRSHPPEVMDYRWNDSCGICRPRPCLQCSCH